MFVLCLYCGGVYYTNILQPERYRIKMLITYIEDISFLPEWRSIFVIKAQIASWRADYLQKTKYLFTGGNPA